MRRGHTYPILRGIPRFIDGVRDGEDLRKVYADSFGHQWTTYDWPREVDREEFYKITDFTPETLHGKIVLDVGCGGGRFARIAAPECAEFFGFDYSIAVDKAREITNSPNAHFVQCDVNKHPFKPEMFDIVYSHGVLHHTPDTKKSFDHVPQLVKPGGILYVCVFRKTFELLQWSDRFWRERWNKLPIEQMDKLCDRLSSLSKLPFPIFLKRFFWFSVQPTHELRKCCLYDWYAPTYHHEHTVDEVFGWFREAGFPNPKYIDAWPGVPPSRKYRKPTFWNSFRLGQILGVAATKSGGASAARPERELASSA
jgi:SAM-dependent methyltransferase